MDKIYVSCPACDYFFSYDSSHVNPDGSILLTCPKCGLMFSIQEGPPILPVPNCVEESANESATEDFESR